MAANYVLRVFEDKLDDVLRGIKEAFKLPDDGGTSSNIDLKGRTSVNILNSSVSHRCSSRFGKRSNNQQPATPFEWSRSDEDFDEDLSYNMQPIVCKLPYCPPIPYTRRPLDNARSYSTVLTYVPPPGYLPMTSKA